MKKIAVTTVLLFVLAAGVAVAQQTAEMVTQGWPEESQKAAREMHEKYGVPTEVTSSRLIWTDKGPWKSIVVYREPVRHDFPGRHMDVLEQTIAYKVPVDKFDELADFDGSVFAERTAGTLTARCDSEAANILALNLADKIVKGETTVVEARDTFSETIKALEEGEKPELTQALQFEAPSLDETRDLGKPVMPQ